MCLCLPSLSFPPLQGFLLKVRELQKQLSNIPTFDSNELDSLVDKAETLLRQLRVLKFEAIAVESFRQLKQIESIKRVLSKEMAAVATGKISRDHLLPQLMDEVDKVMNPTGKPLQH